MDHLAHAQQCVILDSLSGAYEEHVGQQPLRHVLEAAPAVMRRHDADHDLGARQSFL